MVFDYELRSCSLELDDKRWIGEWLSLIGFYQKGVSVLTWAMMVFMVDVPFNIILLVSFH